MFRALWLENSIRGLPEPELALLKYRAFGWVQSIVLMQVERGHLVRGGFIEYSELIAW